MTSFDRRLQECENMSHTNQAASFGTLFSTLAALTSPPQGSLASRPSYPALPGLQVRGDVRHHLRAAVETIQLWRRRGRDRRILQNLDDQLLRDIGLSRAEVEAEARKPFWRAESPRYDR
jgi:uncharacterized protein YjiS (DUF1127 family)